MEPSKPFKKQQLEPGLCQAGSLSDLWEEQGRERNLGSLLVCFRQILWELCIQGGPCSFAAVTWALFVLGWEP